MRPLLLLLLLLARSWLKQHALSAELQGSTEEGEAGQLWEDAAGRSRRGLEGWRSRRGLEEAGRVLPLLLLLRREPWQGQGQAQPLLLLPPLPLPASSSSALVSAEGREAPAAAGREFLARSPLGHG